ncbi:MAG TPA: universal stress protein [Mycobacteriales bacterium]|nr:universal stress protein [Mycobacteriales bacterium]
MTFDNPPTAAAVEAWGTREAGDAGALDDAVVVGIDNTVSAERAVVWAAHEAALRGAILVVCHAYRKLGPPANQLVENARRDTAWRLVRHGAALAREAEPGLHVVPLAIEGPVRRGLCEAVERPGLLVVGCRHRGSVAALLLGSTGAEPASRTPYPVAVVRDAHDPGWHLFGGHIVVGVDGQCRSRAAVAYAFAEASRRSVPLVAVHAGLLGPESSRPDERSGEPYGDRPASAWNVLEAAVEPHRAIWPGVRVTLTLRDGVPAAKGLLGAAQGAALLVVGTVGYGRVGEAAGRSISRAAVTAAPCPVIVVPAAAALPAALAMEGGPR